MPSTRILFDGRLGSLKWLTDLLLLSSKELTKKNHRGMIKAPVVGTMDPMWENLPVSLKNRLDDIDFKHKTSYPDAREYAQLAERREADAIQLLDTILESFKVDNLSQKIELLARNNRSHPTLPSGPGYLTSSRRNTKPSSARQL